MELKVDYDDEKINAVRGYYFEINNPFNHYIIDRLYLDVPENDKLLKEELKFLPKEIYDNCLFYGGGTKKKHFKWFKKIRICKYIVSYISKKDLPLYTKWGFINIANMPKNTKYVGDYCVWRENEQYR